MCVFTALCVLKCSHLEHALLDSLTAHIAQMMDAGHEINVVHLVDENNSELGVLHTRTQ